MRELRKGQQIDYSDFYTPEDAKKAAHKPRKDDKYKDDDDDSEDDLVPVKKLAKPSSKAQPKEKEPTKKKSAAKVTVKAGSSSPPRENNKKKRKLNDAAAGETDAKAETKKKKRDDDRDEKKKMQNGEPDAKKKKAVEPTAAGTKEKSAKEKERKREKESANATSKPEKKVVKPVTSSIVPKSSKPLNSSSSDSSEVTALRKKYDELKHLRETESERLLQEAKALAQEEKKTYERMISKLKQEVSTLSSRVQDDQIKREKEIEKLQTENRLRLEKLERQYADSNEDSHAQRKRIKELEAQLNESKRRNKSNDKALSAAARSASSASRAVEDNLQLAQANKLLEIYRLVTSTEIQLIETLEDDDDPSCTDVSCTTIDSATGKHFQFELGVPEDEHEEIEYLPGDAPSKDIKIPSYLRDELSFKRPEMTKFMRTILDVVIRKNAKSSR
ncbi:hypothetical protein FI667_g1001, partial [Globisporangium splendens]